MTQRSHIPSVSVSYNATGASTKSNELGMRAMQERVYQKRGEQYLLIKSPPASGKSRALMFIALDKLHNQGIKQAIVTVPEKAIGSSFANEPLSEFARSGLSASFLSPTISSSSAPTPPSDTLSRSSVSRRLTTG